MMQRPDRFQLDRNHPLAKGLVFAGLGFGPGSGAMFDTSLHKNHGTLTNMDPATDWVFVPELGRWGLDFDGSDDFVNHGDNFSIGDTFTISLWLYHRSHAGWASLLSKSSSNAGSACDFGIKFASTTNGIVAVRSGTDGSVYGGNVATNQWMHLTVVCGEAIQQKFYNGVNVLDTSGIGGATTTNTASRVFGIGRNYSLYTSAIMADVLCFSRALTPNEIADLADPSNVYLSGLIAGRPRRRYFLPSSPATSIIPHVMHYRRLLNV